VQDHHGQATGHVYRHEGKRGPVWRAKVRLGDGRHVHRRIGPAWSQRGRPPAGHYTQRTAETWLRDTLRQADDGTLAGLVRTGRTVDALATEYLGHLERDKETKPSTLRDYRSVLRAHILPEFGDSAPEDVTAAHVERWQRQMTAAKTGRPLSNRTRVKVLTLLNGLMQYAVARYKLSGNPVAEVAKPKTHAAAGIDVLGVEEVHALVRAAAGEQDAAVFLTAALTGLRRGELIALRWRHVDFNASSVRVVESYAGDARTAPKSGQGRTVPLAPEVAQTLAKLGQRATHTAPDDLVFVGPSGSYLDGSALRRRYKLALKAAGLRDLRFHDLRHTFGTRCAAAGVDLWRLRNWLGHANQRTTDVYAHYAPRAADAALIADAFAGDLQTGPNGDPASTLGGTVRGTIPGKPVT